MQDLSHAATSDAPRPRGLRLSAADNVAVTLGNVESGPIELIGPGDDGAVVVNEEISSGHKIALRPIGKGEAVVKCGVEIGFATAPIKPGAWVHTHNCRSGLDERSHTLDLHSGAPTDTRYV